MITRSLPSSDKHSKHWHLIHYDTLQYIIIHCNTLQYIVIHSSDKHSKHWHLIHSQLHLRFVMRTSGLHPLNTFHHSASPFLYNHDQIVKVLTSHSTLVYCLNLLPSIWLLFLDLCIVCKQKKTKRDNQTTKQQKYATPQYHLHYNQKGYLQVASWLSPILTGPTPSSRFWNP